MPSAAQIAANIANAQHSTGTSRDLRMESLFSGTGSSLHSPPLMSLWALIITLTRAPVLREEKPRGPAPALCSNRGAAAAR